MTLVNRSKKIESRKTGVIPVFVPHLGCPHDCVFCNQKKITGQSSAFDSAEIIKEIDSYLETMKVTRYPIEIAFYGGSFTGIDKNLQIEYLKIARRYINDGHIHGIRLSTRPDYINEDILSLLKEYGVTTIELGVQSLMEPVLKASNRGHTEDDVYSAVAHIRKHDFTLGLQMMIGLPSDTLEYSKQTAMKLIGLEPDFVRIYPTVVIKDTELETLYLNGKYQALSVDDAVEWLSEIMPMFSEARIKVIRVGLQATDELTEGSSRVAGAYHPSMRQLVSSEIIKNRIVAILKRLVHKESTQSTLGVTIEANSRNWTELRGIKQKNFFELKEMFKNINFEFSINEEVESSTIKIEIVVNDKTEVKIVKID